MTQETIGNKTHATGNSTRRRRRLWWFVPILGVVVVLGVIVHGRLNTKPENRFFDRSSPLAVAVAPVTTGDVPILINALGTVTPLATVTVRPQVTGPITKIAFTEGQMVKAGDLLAEIDPRPYQATLDQAKGQLQRDQAALANARVDLDRYKTLLAQDAVSEQQYATQKATVSQDEALVAADKATVESAQLNLSYCRITAPVSGRVGLRQVDPGNLVQANQSTGIVTVTQMQPISVVFTVPEDDLREILQRFNAGDQLMIEAYDRNMQNKIATGVLASTDNQIDTTTGTLKLRAKFDNAKGELFPNQFVNVKLLLTTHHDQMLVPGAAVQNGNSDNFVYVVDGDSNTVSMRTVVTGPSVGNNVSIVSGLKPGDVVVVDGADQLKDGARIQIPGTTPALNEGAGNGDARRSGPHGRRQRHSGFHPPAGGGPSDRS